MTGLLRVALFCARRFLEGCSQLDSGAAVLGWVFRHDPFIVKDIMNLIREVMNGWMVNFKTLKAI